MLRVFEAWGRARRWPAAEWRLTALSVVAVPVAAGVLRLFGFYGTWSRVAAIDAGRVRVDVTQVARAVGRVRRFGPFRGNCLSTSIALLWLLRRGGHDAVLRLGTQLAPTGLTAHAWVELGGRVLNDSADVIHRYTPFGDWREVSRAGSARFPRHDA